MCQFAIHIVWKVLVFSCVYIVSSLWTLHSVCSCARLCVKAYFLTRDFFKQILWLPFFTIKIAHIYSLNCLRKLSTRLYTFHVCLQLIIIMPIERNCRICVLCFTHTINNDNGLEESCRNTQLSSNTFLHRIIIKQTSKLSAKGLFTSMHDTWMSILQM